MTPDERWELFCRILVAQCASNHEGGTIYLVRRAKEMVDLAADAYTEVRNGSK